VVGFSVNNFEASLTVLFDAPLPLPVGRYIAGFISPLNGRSQGNENDIVSIQALLVPNTYQIILGSLPRAPWQQFTFVVVGNGCKKTLAACSENGQLANMWAMPFTPGTKSFMAGSELVKPTGPNIP
jgi:hypothetical protein